MKTEMANLNIRLPIDAHIALRTYCAKKRVTAQSIVEPLVMKWLLDHKAKETADADSR